MNRYLRPADNMPKIYLYREPVDFRKSFRGLAAIIDQELGHDPFGGGLYAFTNQQHNKIKCLFWEHNGFVLYYKSLAEEKFKWPQWDQVAGECNSVVAFKKVVWSSISVIDSWF